MPLPHPAFDPGTPLPPPWGPAITSPDQIIVGDPSTGAPLVLSPGSPGQALILDPSTGHLVWGSASSALSSLTDVTISGLHDKDVIAWNAGAGKWENTPDDDQNLTGMVTVTGDASGNPALVVRRGSIPSGDVFQVRTTSAFLFQVDIGGLVTLPGAGLTVAGNTNLRFTQFGPTGSVHMTVMGGGDTLALFNAGVEQAALDISHGPLPYLMLNSSKLFMASGDPTSHSLAAVANSGDLYVRTDTPTTTNQRLYMCTGVSTWTALV